MIDSLFGSKTRVKLLRLFMNNPTEAYYVREITRRIDEQINSVRRELKNLGLVGIIQSKAVKNQLYYSANRSYRFYKEFKNIFSNRKSEYESIDEDLSDFMAIGDVKLILQTGKLTGNDCEVDLLVVGESLNKTRLKLLVKSMEKDSAALNYVTMPFSDFYYRMSIRDRFIYDIIDSDYNVLLDVNGILNKETEETNGN
ncbi:MAG: winged helix-turn-helix domain-containing protein [Candidatus Nomurabacteria bacterium]|jgi:predicted transcriptional regulator|nr:winged helix-turn-helix domain-containing protein [Candidatus Nomurabacteria bacterium]